MQNTSIYGDSTNVDMFQETKVTFPIKRGERILSNESYIKQLYQVYSGGMVSHPVNGQVVKAIYAGVDLEDILFDAGFKDFVRIPKSKNEIKYVTDLKTGSELSVMIESVSNEPYLIKGTISGIYERSIHIELDALKENEHIIAIPKSINPAGYDMEISRNGLLIAAFMPNTLAGVNKLWDPESIIGKEMEVCIESFSEEKGTYIVSRRKYLSTLIPSEVKKLRQNTVYSGHVTGCAKFGVFVEFNECLTGMIHKSSINPDYAERIDEIIPGTQIDFYVKEIIKDKIILTQILKESLWDTLRIGDVISGIVKDNKAFGSLISLDEETVGLVHQSELEKFGKTFNTGQNTNVKITSIDKMNRKILLSIVK
jgi:ribosomal protein S1